MENFELKLHEPISAYVVNNDEHDSIKVLINADKVIFEDMSYGFVSDEEFLDVCRVLFLKKQETVLDQIQSKFKVQKFVDALIKKETVTLYVGNRQYEDLMDLRKDGTVVVV